LEKHVLGAQRDLRFTVTLAGVPTNPDELTFFVREPDGVLTTYVKGTDDEVEAVSTGVWRVLWLCRKAGVHHARAYATGNVIQPDEISFFVRRSKVLEPNDALPTS
jgi:hypothetical protein